MQKESKKILIVGSSAKEYALAKKIKEYGNEVIVAPGNKCIAEIVKCADIRENDVTGLLEYVLENAIDLTIASSEISIKSDIASIFQVNNQLIFAPTANSAEFTYSKAAAKRFLYKQRILAPHFGIYDKLQSAIDYLKKASMPQVIYSDIAFEQGDRLVASTFSMAKTFVEDLFLKANEKVVLEDYVYGHEFTFYLITDGYHYVPIVSTANYKFLENGDGGILTSGIGAYVPDYKISKEIESNILKDVVKRVIESLQNKETPYLGILGIDCVLSEDKCVILSFRNFLSDHDSDAILSLIDDNIVDLFMSCVNGTLEDYDSINLSDKSAVSCVVSSRKENSIIDGLNNVDSSITPFNLNKNEYLEYLTKYGKNFVITATASTLSRARKFLYDDLSMINFDGIKYRTDICEQVEKF